MAIALTYTEQELVSLLRNRDNKAYAYLYDNYASALYSIILQIVSDGELTNDVLQEVFVNIWRRIEQYDATKGRLFTWMMNIARNAAIDTLRSRSYQNSRKNQSIGENVDTIRVTDVIQPGVDTIGLRKVLEKLKEEQRILIELAYFKGYTHEEIAELEKLPLGTVKTRIRNALIQLRGLLK
ncbi:RNA polymerase subunit sigma-70 [Niastella vici]|uniref:RNA polymerase subunit sigma-70 n=1 Tax=Niastella vici TaxID=1703345 RepID=A0A1V9G2V9_9BACT|nr:sigma-70 family RNA polymerase sigma factor [Niastella vici]OQP64969.1 RNA polymerase subunit sigma-70 [Niastella vici]